MTAQHLTETQISSDGTHPSQRGATPPAATGPQAYADHPKSRLLRFRREPCARLPPDRNQPANRAATFATHADATKQLKQE
jgi:hypothetical protein